MKGRSSPFHPKESLALVPARDRERLERLCRYVGRPALATERLSELPDGRVAYALRRRWQDGTTHFVFEPLELIEKLVALVPFPRSNRVHYSGVLAPNACLRKLVVPAGPEGRPSAHPDRPPVRQPRTRPGTHDTAHRAHWVESA